MSSGWTAERRAAQSAAIQKWRPWERSTGPRTDPGEATASRNACRGGRRVELRAEMATLRELIRELTAEQRNGI
jgi:hypothetical protein